MLIHKIVKDRRAGEYCTSRTFRDSSTGTNGGKSRDGEPPTYFWAFSSSQPTGEYNEGPWSVAPAYASLEIRNPPL